MIKFNPEFLGQQIVEQIEILCSHIRENKEPDVAFLQPHASALFQLCDAALELKNSNQRARA